MWVDLFYDKYIGDAHGNGDHHYNNPVTNQLTFDTIKDGSCTYYESKDAVKFYNRMFKSNPNFTLPPCLHECNLFKLKVYEKEIEGLKAVVVVVGVNTHLMKKHFMETKTVPFFDFIKLLCRFHLAYSKNSDFVCFNKSDDSTIIKNIEYIKTNASKPVDYTFNPQIPQPTELNIELFPYQKCSVNWMIQKEKNLQMIRYNVNDEIIFGDLYYDNNFQQLDLNENKPSVQFYGGALIDEVGLGKTIQIISLAMKHRSTRVGYVEKGCTKLVSNATLVLCPNQLCGQWLRECQNRITKSAKLNVVQLMTKRDFDKLKYIDLLEADIVIVSYNFLNNPSFKKEWMNLSNEINNEESKMVNVSKKSFNDCEWQSDDFSMVRTVFKNMASTLLTKPFETLYKCNPLIQLIRWHRIVVDEFHEIYKSGVIRYVHNMLPFLDADYKWIVSATPFINSECVHNIVNFLTKYTCGTNTKFTNREGIIYTISEIVEYLSYNCFRRNTKDSTEKEYKLPDITEEVRWLKFSQTESLMYNAHLTNKFNDKAGIYLRKLCCHPQLAEETKSVLANCKTLEDVEKNIVKFYQFEVDKAKVYVNKFVKRIAKYNSKIKLLKISLLKKEAIKLGLIEDDKEKKKDDAMFMIDDDDKIEAETNEDETEMAEIDVVQENDENETEDDEIKEPKEILDILFSLDTKKIWDKSVFLQNLKNFVVEQEQKLDHAKQILNGKQSTYNFFNNVLTRLKKIMDRDDDENEKGDDASENEDDSDSDSDDEDKEDDEKCGICFSDITNEELGVTVCGHLYCFECITMWVNKQARCPYCKKELKKTDIFSIACEKKKKEIPNDPKAITKQQLINSVGTKLANLILFLRDTKEHVIIFSQWEDLLIRVGRILKLNNIPNVFCKGNCYQRDKAIRDFNSDDKIKVIMLSSDSSASGTNLTKASIIIFIEPIYGTYEFRRNQERQAVGRAHRLGQLNPIRVIRLLVRNTIENEIYDVNVQDNKNHEPIFKKTVEINI